MTFKIVQVIQEFGRDGGAETVAYELARAWDRAGISNCVVTSSANDETASGKVERCAAWLGNIPTRGAFRHLGRLIAVPVFTLAATATLRYHLGDVIISHGDTLMGDILVVHAVNAANLEEKRKAGNWGWLLNPLHLWVALRDRFMLRGLRYRTHVAVSPRTASELKRIHHVPDERIRVIPNGIDLDRFKKDPSARDRIRSELGIPGDAKLLLFAGHEFDRKGLAFVLGALERLAPDTWLLVAGSDNPAPYRKHAGSAIDRVVFAGHRTDMPALYSACDAFVLPTAYETFSLVCMEALASGVPIFATKVGGIEDYLEEGVNGFAIERDAETIVRALKPVLEDPSRLAELGRNARETATRFAWDDVAARYAVLAGEVYAAKLKDVGGRLGAHKHA